MKQMNKLTFIPQGSVASSSCWRIPPAMVSLSDKISLKFFVPSIVLKVVEARSLVELSNNIVLKWFKNIVIKVRDIVMLVKKWCKHIPCIVWDVTNRCQGVVDLVVNHSVNFNRHRVSGQNFLPRETQQGSALGEFAHILFIYLLRIT